MLYHSTRSDSHFVTGAQAVLLGQSADGGLFVPKTIPRLSLPEILALDVKATLAAVVGAYLEELPQLSGRIEKAYGNRFSVPDLTPVKQAGPYFVLELFHGPTAAFKDVALCLLPQLVTAAKEVCGQKEETLIITATSGDTGKAALEGFRDVEGTRIGVFYPDGGVSPIQHRQMVTQEGENVFVCGIHGNFDDAQSGVKALLEQAAKEDLFPGFRLTTANSINIGRLAPQIAYYFKAYGDLVRRGAISLGDQVNFAVPTGNFGDILAGYLAGEMGLPVGKLICASNANRVLTDLIEKGVYDRRRPFLKTLSPSMDILISSNFERLLYFLSRDAALVSRLMASLSEAGVYVMPRTLHQRLREKFWGASCSDDKTRETIRRVYDQWGYLADPHTAAAFFGAERYREETGDLTPTVVLATASPYKFPQAVLGALETLPREDDFQLQKRLWEKTGVPIPPCLTGLEKKERRHGDVIEKGEMASYVREKGGKR